MESHQALLAICLKKGAPQPFKKNDGKELGSCFTTQNYGDIPKVFCPKIPLQAKMVKDIKWKEAARDIALVLLSTLAPLPYGKEIKSTMLDENFIDELKSISTEHGFWEKMMVDEFKQEDTKFVTLPIVNNLNASKTTFKGCNPCHPATKGFQNVWPSNYGPPIDTSSVGKKHEVEQAKVNNFFHHNPMPSCVKIIDKEDEAIAQIPIQRSTGTTTASNGTNSPLRHNHFRQDKHRYCIQQDQWKQCCRCIQQS
jgi:hypothetical protein